MANPNPQNQFTSENNPSTKVRKRKVFSEMALLNAAERKGESVLLFYEELFEIEKLKDGLSDYAVKERNGEKIKLADRINAANAWSKLVFLQPKDGEDNEQNQDFNILVGEILSELMSLGDKADLQSINLFIDVLKKVIEKKKQQQNDLTQSIQSVNDENVEKNS